MTNVIDTIDDYGDRQYQGGQRQQVQAKADNLQCEERSDQRHRNSDSRNQRRTHILQEDIHHDEHQDKCLNQGLDHLVDRSEQEVVGTLGNIDT